jgi:hypothetical protein
MEVASMPNEVKITIGQIKPQSGTEGRGSWVDKLAQLSRTVGGAQAANPPYMPFRAGTLTGAGNALMETARSNMAAETLAQQQAGEVTRHNVATEGLAQQQANAPVIPNATTGRFALRSAGIQSLQMWQDRLAELGLGPDELPPTSESEEWINATLPGIKAGLYQEAPNLGLSSEDAEAISLDIENLLRTRAGLPPKTAKEKAADESSLTGTMYGDILEKVLPDLIQPPK